MANPWELYKQQQTQAIAYGAGSNPWTRYKSENKITESSFPKPVTVNTSAPRTSYLGSSSVGSGVLSSAKNTAPVRRDALSAPKEKMRSSVGGGIPDAPNSYNSVGGDAHIAPQTSQQSTSAKALTGFAAGVQANNAGYMKRALEKAGLPTDTYIAPAQTYKPEQPLTGFAAGVQANNEGYRALAMKDAANKTGKQVTAAVNGALNAGLNYNGSLTGEQQRNPKHNGTDLKYYNLSNDWWDGYNKSYEAVKSARTAYEFNAAYKTFSDYYAEYEKWRSTIRGEEEIRAEMDEIDKLLRDSDRSQFGRGYGLAYGGSLDAYLKEEQEQEKLREQYRLLNEELGFSKNFVYNALSGNEDFALMSLPGESQLGTNFWQRLGDSDVQKAYDYINDIGGYREKLDTESEKAGSSLTPQFEAYKYMSEEQKSNFNYLYNTQGEETAAKYLEWLKAGFATEDAWVVQSLNALQGVDIAEGLDTKTQKALYGLRAGLGQFGSGMKQIFSEEEVPTSAVQYAGQAARDELGKVGKFIYDAGMVTGNMLPSIALSTITAGAGAPAMVANAFGSITLGASAGGNAYNQALKEGYAPSQARTYGTLVGASEASLQYLIGGIGRLGGVADDILLKKVAAIDKAWLRMAATGAVKIGNEVLEENLQEFIEPAIRSIVFDEKYNAPNMEELIYTTLLTVATTGFMESGDIVRAGAGNISPVANTQNVATQALDVEENSVTASRKENGLVYDSYVRRNIDSKTADIINTVAKALKIKVLFADSVAGGMANAQISNGTVLIEKGNPNPVRFLFGHEITHRMQELAPKEYSRLRDTIAANSESVDAAIRKMQDNYAKYGKDINKENVMDEVVADYVGRLLEDKGELERFIAKNRGDRSLMQKLRDFIHEIRLRLMDSEYAARLRQVEQRLSETLDAAVNQTQNIESTQKNAAQESGGEKLSFKGYTQDGRGIYEANFPAGTPKSIKAQRILSYIKNVWSKRPINLVIYNPDGTTRTIQAQFDPTYDESGNEPSDASKLMGGNRHGTASERRATLDLADDYYQIASESEYNYSKDEEGKSSITHNGVREWHYFVNDILFREYGETEAIPYRVTINVKERGDGNFVYSFNAEKQNGRMDTRRTLHADVNPSENREANAQPSKYSISQKDGTVNGQYSLKTSQEPFSFLYLERLAEQAKKSGNLYTQRILQRKIEEALKNFGKTEAETSAPMSTIYADYLRKHNMQDDYETETEIGEGFEELNADLENDANSDTINTEDIVIGKSLGAKAKNYDIELPNGETIHLTEGTKVFNVKIIAGKGRDRQIDEIDFLLERFGGNELEWQKKKGLGYVDYQGESFLARLHWYEEPTAGKHKWKVKPDADGNWFLYED